MAESSTVAPEASQDIDRRTKSASSHLTGRFNMYKEALQLLHSQLQSKADSSSEQLDVNKAAEARWINEIANLPSKVEDLVKEFAGVNAEWDRGHGTDLRIS
ncbi:MAG: hypothetical protein Q9168_007642 [Polycauliona sp. 1 TL-2023]